MKKINALAGISGKVLSKDQMKNVLGGEDAPKKYKCCYDADMGGGCSACVAVNNPFCQYGHVVTC